MLLDSRENSCILDILDILSKKKSKYSIMFKKTKVSHTTLQRALKEIETKKFIKKYNKGHQNVDYEITEKGKKLFNSLNELREILR